jgi:Protein of unknown function (DUF1631)
MDTSSPQLSTQDFDALIMKQKALDTSASQALSGTANALSANLIAALAWSIEHAPQVINHLISRSVQSMDRKAISLAGSPQAQMLEDASAALEQCRGLWIEQYPALLRMAMAYPAPEKIAALLPQIDLRICAAEAAVLDDLVKAQGAPRNPLAPAAYVQALLELVARTDASPAQRPIWAAHLLAALSSQLAWLYLQLHAVLRDPSPFETSTAIASQDFSLDAQYAYGTMAMASDAAASHAEFDADPQTLALAQQARRTVMRLRDYLSLPAEPVLDLALAQHMPAIEAMVLDLDQAELLMAQIQERGLPMPSLEDEPENPAGHIAQQSQVLTSQQHPASLEDQIASLIETYQNTTSSTLQRTPPQLRSQLENLKSPLLILVQEDATVLTNAEHPARQFLELISQRSLRYANETVDDFSSFILPVEKLISSISSMKYVNTRVFEKAIAKLVKYWAIVDEKEAQQELSRAQEEERILAAQQLAGRLSFELIGRKDASDAPAMIKQFLMKPWAQVLARAQLIEQDSASYQRYMQAMVALLWSVSLARAAPRKSEHAMLIFELMPQIQEGLQSIGMPEGQIKDLLADISKLHDTVQACPVGESTDEDDAEPVPELL